MYRKITIGMLLLLATLTAIADDTLCMRRCRPLTSTHTAIRHKAPRRASTKTPYIGNRHQLTILASFQDKKFINGSPSTLWNRILNESHFNEEPFRGSVHDYFYDQSYGQFNLTFDLHEITLPDSLNKYKSTSQDDENSKYMVNDIIDILVAKGIDWSPYDWDGDGTIEQLLIIYAGKGMNDGGDDNSIWPHQWWLSEHEDCEARQVSSNEKNYIVDCYCCVQEMTAEDDYGCFGTICHEYSHCFGLPDFYNGNKSFLKYWDLMDSGNYKGNGFCPTSYSAHERMLMGWLQPKELTSDTIVANMPQLAEEPVAYLVRNNGYDQEYYFIENRQQNRWDEGLPGKGIIIFHIDYSEGLWRSTTEYVNTNKLMRYHIIPANNITSIYSSANWTYPYQNNTELTNTSSPAATLIHPNSDGTNLMSKPITEIQVTDGMASFHFQNDMVSAVPTVSLSAENVRQYFSLQGHALGNDLALLPQGIYIVRDAQGNTIKIVKR